MNDIKHAGFDTAGISALSQHEILNRPVTKMPSLRLWLQIPKVGGNE
jgi:hypothetical protein